MTSLTWVWSKNKKERIQKNQKRENTSQLQKKESTIAELKQYADNMKWTGPRDDENIFRRFDDEALEAYKEILKRDDTKSEHHTWLGKCLTTQGRFAEATPSFETALKLAPESFGCKLDLAQNYKRLGKNEDALSCLEDLSARDPENKDILFLMGDCYREMSYKRGNTDEAAVALNMSKAQDIFSRAVGVPGNSALEMKKIINLQKQAEKEHLEQGAYAVSLNPVSAVA